jgi:hypothetical protein
VLGALNLRATGAMVGGGGRGGSPTGGAGGAGVGEAASAANSHPLTRLRHDRRVRGALHGLAAAAEAWVLAALGRDARLHDLRA